MTIYLEGTLTGIKDFRALWVSIAVADQSFVFIKDGVIFLSSALAAFILSGVFMVWMINWQISLHNLENNADSVLHSLLLKSFWTE